MKKKTMLVVGFLSVCTAFASEPDYRAELTGWNNDLVYCNNLTAAKAVSSEVGDYQEMLKFFRKKQDVSVLALLNDCARIVKPEIVTKLENIFRVVGVKSAEATHESAEATHESAEATHESAEATHESVSELNKEAYEQLVFSFFVALRKENAELGIKRCQLEIQLQKQRQRKLVNSMRSEIATTQKKFTVLGCFKSAVLGGVDGIRDFLDRCKNGNFAPAPDPDHAQFDASQE